jgi:hypothetical protein
MPKSLTREQIQSRKDKGVHFVRDVVEDPDRADEIAEESLEDYAERRKIQIVANPRGGSMARVRLINPPRVSNSRRKMMQANPQSGRAELLARIRELQEENDELQDKLDKVADLAAAPDDAQDEDPDELVDALNDIIDVVAPCDDEDKDGDLGNE